jgi:hypothetical protein
MCPCVRVTCSSYPKAFSDFVAIAGPHFKAGAIDISSVAIPAFYTIIGLDGENRFMKKMIYCRQFDKANGIIGTQADH